MGSVFHGDRKTKSFWRLRRQTAHRRTDWKCVSDTETKDIRFPLLDIPSGHFYLAEHGDISNWTRQLHGMFASVAFLGISTNLPENRDHLIRLEHKLQGAIDTIISRPSSSLGWKNQLSHAETRLAGVRKILAASPGEHPFPSGRTFRSRRCVEYSMTEDNMHTSKADDAMRNVLEAMLERDDAITARAVARLGDSRR
jgi:hypothetical protein